MRNASLVSGREKVGRRSPRIPACAAFAQPSRDGAALDEARFIGMPLREAAAFSKSWELEEASVGVAAINAWHNRAAWLPVRENADAFCDTEAARRESGSALSGGSPIWKSGSNRSAIYM